MVRKNIFVVGLDAANLDVLQALPDAPRRYRFHGLSNTEQLLASERIDLLRLLEECERTLASFGGSIDAIVGYWDFPVTTMVPILCQRFGLPGAPLPAVLKCEHKYWSRLEQQRVIEEYPPFGVIELDGPERLPPGVSFPAWVKPIKSAASVLAFYVEDDDQLAHALREIRGGIALMGDPFELALKRVDLPPEVAQVGAKACLAEEAVGGHQVTLEGFSFAGRVHVYGIIDSIRYPHSSSFLRYQHPADLPKSTSRQLVRCAKRVIGQIGLDNSTFNIEFFCDLERDSINLLEVNPRHSQSHARLFQYVDGMANHEFMVRLGLGQQPPRLTAGAGRYPVAARWFLRRFTDGMVCRGPTPAEIQALERKVDGTTVHVVAHDGRRLSDLPQQDSYSYELARIDMGGRSETDLIEKYERCVDSLVFEFDE